MSESETIAKYQPVIKSLLPYANQGRLLEGLNKFTGKLSSSVRKVLKSEVERLMSYSYEGADNSSFAAFPVREFKHFGLDMRLDEIGENILEKETKRYFDKYTVGVRESITSSEHYQQQLKIENLRRIIEHFCVDAQSLRDIDFGDDIAVSWLETVDVESNGKIEPFTIASISMTGVTIESRRVTGIKKGVQVKVHVDKKSSLAFKGTTLLCESGISNFNRDTKKHEHFLAFTPAILEKIKEPLKAFLLKTSEQSPLTDKLESEKTTQVIERHILLESSPWIPIFISDDGLDIKALITPQNMSLNKRIAVTENIPSMRLLDRIMKEVGLKDEVYLFKAKVEHHKAMINISATLTQLLSAGLLETFLYHARRSGNLTITQIRAKSLDEHVLSQIPTSVTENREHLNLLSHVLFARDVTQSALKVLPCSNANIKPLPRQLIDDSEQPKTKIFMQSQLDRRTEPRFMLNKPVKIYLSLLKKLSGELLDISPSGLKIRIAPSLVSQLPYTVKIDINAIALKAGKYKVISQCPTSGIVRLAVTGTRRQKRETITSINSLIQKNEGYFRQRDKTAVDKEEFALLWEVAARYQPSLGVICVKNKNPNDRMKTVYAESFPRDAGPFKGDGTRLYMHGVFADKHTDTPQSSLLAGMINNIITQKEIIHCRHRRKKNIIPITDEQFYTVGRESLRAMSINKKADVFVSDVQCFRVDLSENDFIHNRVDWLKEHSPALGRTFKKSLSLYTHVIFCTDVSLLHNALLMHSHSTEVAKGDPNSNTDTGANRSVA